MPICRKCQGAGRVQCPVCMGRGTRGNFVDAHCGGKGSLLCPECIGSGSISGDTSPDEEDFSELNMNDDEEIDSDEYSTEV